MATTACSAPQGLSGTLQPTTAFPGQAIETPCDREKQVWGWEEKGGGRGERGGVVIPAGLKGLLEFLDALQGSGQVLRKLVPLHLCRPELPLRMRLLLLQLCLHPHMSAATTRRR